MNIFRVSSYLSKSEILEKTKKLGVIAVSSKLASSKEQFELAHILAKKSFSEKTNIANNIELEFLLWLAGETDLRKAFAKNDFEPDDLLTVSFGKLPKKTILADLKANEKPIFLRKSANAIELEKISLSRI